MNMVQNSMCSMAPFLMKTYEMVENSEMDELISWGTTGTSFVIWKPVEFARDLLPLHFKHCNFSSFVRQLNTYGFRKVVPDRWEFSNDNFRRGEQRLLSDIRRRKTVLPQIATTRTRNISNAVHSNKQQVPTSSILNSAEVHSSSSSSSQALPPLPPPRSKQVFEHFTELTIENKMLKKDNETLSIELAHVKSNLNQLLGFLSNYVDLGKLNFDSLVQESVMNDQVKRHEEVEKEKVAKEGLKIFGVLLKSFEGEDSTNISKKRCEDQESTGEKPSKMSFGLPWIGISNSR